MKITTGATGKNHVTSENHRNIIASLAGNGSYIANILEMLEPEAAPNNKIKIASGALIHHGCVGEVPEGSYDEVPFESGTTGTKRIDLIVARYKKDPNTNYEEMDWHVIQGTPDASNPAIPAYTVGNMQSGDLVDDCPFCKIILDGVNVSVKKVLSVASNISTLQEITEKQAEQLQAHTGMLEDHTDTLSNNASTLNNHTKTLQDHKSALDNHAGTLTNHNNTLSSQTKQLESITNSMTDVYNQMSNMNTQLMGQIESVQTNANQRCAYNENEIARVEIKLTEMINELYGRIN